MSKFRLHATEYGEEHAGNSTVKTVVVLHGLFGSGKNLAGICRHLAAQFRVIAFDLPNHGNSPHVDQTTIPEMAECVIDEVLRRHLDSVYLLGHSLGGKVAMCCALRRPNLVEKLVVADIAPVTYPPGHNAIIEAMLSLPGETASRTAADEHLAQTVSDGATRQFLLQNLVKRGETYTWRNNVQGIANSYDELRAGFSPADLTGKFDKPALFIKGENSDYVKQEYLAAIERLFSDYAIVEIAGAGHWLHAEKPREFNEIVINFLM